MGAVDKMTIDPLHSPYNRYQLLYFCRKPGKVERHHVSYWTVMVAKRMEAPKQIERELSFGVVPSFYIGRKIWKSVTNADARRHFRKILR